MIDREFAVRLVEAQLDRESPGQLRVTHVEEHEPAWIVSYQSAAYVRTGDHTQLLAGNGPFSSIALTANCIRSVYGLDLLLRRLGSRAVVADPLVRDRRQDLTGAVDHPGHRCRSGHRRPGTRPLLRPSRRGGQSPQGGE
ncbi:YrhB domain-containing protein [Streptomyces sp. NPDC060027]|uniref:YrhB domain-containing protein n=1 Tax=Streptomyces sp. NPDC060027 TaxID=3347040 RepID=UPI00367D1E78